MTLDRLNLADLKAQSPKELLTLAEELEIENASTMRKGDMMFAILKQLAEQDVPIAGSGVLEVLQDGFGFLRSPDANYLAGPDDIYASPSQIRKFSLRTGDTVEGEIFNSRAKSFMVTSPLFIITPANTFVLRLNWFLTV